MVCYLQRYSSVSGPYVYNEIGRRIPVPGSTMWCKLGLRILWKVRNERIEQGIVRERKGSQKLEKERRVLLS
jgi:hypothetical protein